MKRIIVVFSVLIQNLFGFSQSSNLGFEQSLPGAYTASNAVSGWILSSQTATCGTASAWTPGSSEFSIVSTPILSFPTIGNIGSSPLGGNRVARLNNSTANSSRTKLAHTFSVNGGTYMECAFAGVWEGSSSHQCCAQTGFQITLRNQSGVILFCNNYSLTTGNGCVSSNFTFSNSSTAAWTNWQLGYFDLSPFTGSLITVEVTATDCSFGDHFGTLFFDARTMTGCFNAPYSPPDFPVSYCSGSNIAQLIAPPLGYLSYQWISPFTGSIAAPQGTMSTITVTNPVANSVYSVMLQTYSGCTFISTMAIVPSTVTIAASISNSSCAGGASGSASIVSSGSGAGYNYAWYNSTNSVVGTNSIVNNLSPGTYTVMVTATGSQSASCGTASTTILVGTNPAAFTQVLKPFCSNGQAFLSASGGTNYQWYNNLSPISASLGGTSSSYTVSNPVNGSIYYLSYTSAQSCQDSIKMYLISVSPGSLILASNPLVCNGATNGSITLNMFPASGSVPGNNWFSLVSTGTTTAYSVSINPTASNTFTAAGLVSSGTYSVNAFDGICRYTNNFSITPHLFNYTLSPGNSPTVCSGNGISASINFTLPNTPSQYTYSWTPNNFLNSTNTVISVIVPTVNPGNSATLNYTVVVTPTAMNCPLSKTMTIVVANPLTPSISIVPSLCANSSNYSIQVQPAGGIFMNGSSSAINVNSGVLTPSLAGLGLNTFTYANSIGTCVAISSATYYINSPPQISISGDTIICERESTTIFASGANSYSWSNFGTNSSISVSPTTTSVYQVIGTDTITNCSSSKSLTVAVFPNPTLYISGDTLICDGETTTLNVSGANLYMWNTGNNTSSITISPYQNTQLTVTGTNLQGHCTSTMQVQVAVSDCLGIENKFVSDSEVQFFPNPSQGIFYLRNEHPINVAVTDIYGKLIFENNFETGVHTIDLSSKYNAIYFVKVSAALSTKTFKLITSH